MTATTMVAILSISRNQSSLFCRTICQKPRASEQATIRTFVESNFFHLKECDSCSGYGFEVRERSCVCNLKERFETEFGRIPGFTPSMIPTVVGILTAAS
jgi:hypothetical protein